MDKNEFYTYEDRSYIDPKLSSGEQEKFIDNFRDIQKQNTAQIAEQTHDLGTDIPSNLGGLGGGESYFTSRYQTPQTVEMVNTLESAAQAQALNDVMSNYQDQLQNKYKQAYRKYQARERARQRALQNAALKGGQGDSPKGRVRGNPTDKKAHGSSAASYTDPSTPYSMTSYLDLPSGKMITLYENPSTGNTFKVVGNGEKVYKNGKDIGGLAQPWLSTYQLTGRFPND